MGNESHSLKGCMMKKSFLGYLVVLGYEPILEKLSTLERQIGNNSMMGCLYQVTKHLEAATDPLAPKVLKAVKMREDINVKTTSEPWPSLLIGATQIAAEAVYEYYLQIDSHSPVKP